MASTSNQNCRGIFNGCDTAEPRLWSDWVWPPRLLIIDDGRWKNPRGDRAGTGARSEARLPFGPRFHDSTTHLSIDSLSTQKRRHSTALSRNTQSSLNYLNSISLQHSYTHTHPIANIVPNSTLIKGHPSHIFTHLQTVLYNLPSSVPAHSSLHSRHLPRSRSFTATKNLRVVN